MFGTQSTHNQTDQISRGTIKSRKLKSREVNHYCSSHFQAKLMCEKNDIITCLVAEILEEKKRK